MKYTVGELAKLIEARVEGDNTLEVSGVAAPERAGSRELIYVESPKYSDRAATSASLCVIAPEGVSFAGQDILAQREAESKFREGGGFAA